MVNDAKGCAGGNHRIPYAAIVSIARITVWDNTTNFVVAANHPDALSCSANIEATTITLSFLWQDL